MRFDCFWSHNCNMDSSKYKRVWISSFFIILGLTLAAGSNKHIAPGQVFEFSNGSLYYRTFYVDTKESSLYVGAMDYIFKLDLFNIKTERNRMKLGTTRIDHRLAEDPKDINNHNHIKVIQQFGQNDDRLYICGSHAIDPRNWIIYKNLTLTADNDIGWMSPNSIKCGKYLNVNNGISIMVTNSHSNNDPELYTAMRENEQGSIIPSIFRTEFHNEKNNEELVNMQSRPDTSFDKSAEFIGTFDVGDQVLFFFHENGTVDNQGDEIIVVDSMPIEAEDYKVEERPKTLYSTVARVCKNDKGYGFSRQWSSFSKARLECKDRFGRNFNNLQSVYKVPHNDSYFYASFTTSGNKGIASAICLFAMDDIQKAFDGEFKEIKYLDDNLQSSSKTPQPRPGACSNDSLESSAPINSKYVLMKTVVSPKGNGPIFNISNVIITKLVVEKYKNDGKTSKEYTIFYAGSNEGKVYKIVQRTGEEAREVDNFDVTPGESIQAMEVLPDYNALYVASDNRIKQIAIPLCNKHRNVTKHCSDDPQCKWSKEEKTCILKNGMKRRATSTPPAGVTQPTILKTEFTQLTPLNHTSTTEMNIYSANVQVNQSAVRTSTVKPDNNTIWSIVIPTTADSNTNETSVLLKNVSQIISTTTPIIPTITGTPDDMTTTNSPITIPTIIGTFSPTNITATNALTPATINITTPTTVFNTSSTITPAPAITTTETISTVTNESIIDNITSTIPSPFSNTSADITTVTDGSITDVITSTIPSFFSNTSADITTTTTTTTTPFMSTTSELIITTTTTTTTQEKSKCPNTKLENDFSLYVYITLTAFISVTCCLVLYLILSTIFG